MDRAYYRQRRDAGGNDRPVRPGAVHPFRSGATLDLPTIAQ